MSVQFGADPDKDLDLHVDVGPPGGCGPSEEKSALRMTSAHLLLVFPCCNNPVSTALHIQTGDN